MVCSPTAPGAVILIGIAGCLACLVMPQAVRAQVSATTTGSLNIAAALTVTKISDISFGTVTAGDGTITLDAARGMTNTGGGSPSAGKFMIMGDNRAHVYATFPVSVTLDAPGTSATIGYEPVVIHNEKDQVNQADPFTNGDVVRLRPNSGEHYFWVGGEVFVRPSQPGGIYTGIFTLTVTYQ